MAAAKSVCACSEFVTYDSVCVICQAYTIRTFDVHHIYFRHTLNYVGRKSRYIAAGDL